jgi:putative transposase
MLERGIVVSYETVRRWCAKFGQACANALRRRRPRPGDRWHLDEVFIKINGEQRYLWRAVDRDGTVLDILVQDRRDTAAVRRFFRTLLKKTGAVPRVVVTDRLRSCGAARRTVMPSVGHRQSTYLNNRAENSHQPTRQRERAMKGFRSVGGAQRFLSAFSGISPHFRPPPSSDPRIRLSSRDDRPLRDLGADHRHCRPAHRAVNTQPEPDSTTPRHTVRQPRTQQRDNAHESAGGGGGTGYQRGAARWNGLSAERRPGDGDRNSRGCPFRPAAAEAR